MKTRGWNAEWLECGFSKDEALALRELLDDVVERGITPERLMDQREAFHVVVRKIQEGIHKTFRARSLPGLRQPPAGG